MKNKSIALLFIITTLIITDLHARVHESGTYNRTEDINGIPFTCKIFFDDAEIFKEFTVDRVAVDQKTYEQKKSIACSGELDSIFDTIKCNQLSFEQSCSRLKSEAAVRVIKKVRDDACVLMRKVHEYELEKFFVFKPESIESEAFLRRIEEQLLPALGFCEESGACDEDAGVLARIAHATAHVYQRLLVFYQESVKAALEQADDAKKLQKLLELV